jgi:hypothetical protein
MGRAWAGWVGHSRPSCRSSVAVGGVFIVQIQEAEETSKTLPVLIQTFQAVLIWQAKELSIQSQRQR